jgi:nucleoside-diphosphate-sugar epimerase
MKGPVLVTGATGFLGQHVVAQGLGKFDLHHLSRSGTELPGVRTWKADLLDAEAVERVLGELKPSVIVHLAAAGVMHGAGKTASLFTVNAGATATLLECATRLPQAPVMVLAGSGFEYGTSASPHTEEEALNPFSPYGVSKVAAHGLARLFSDKLPMSWLRFFNLYGPGEKSPRLAPFVIEQVVGNRPVELTLGEQLRDYTCVTDAAEAIWRAVDSHSERRPGLQTLNAATGVGITVRRFVETLGAVLSRRGHSPRFDFGAKPYRPEEPMALLADMSRMQRQWGWLPSTPLETGLSAMFPPERGSLHG